MVAGDQNTLVAVRTRLLMSKSPVAKSLLDLIENKEIGPLKSFSSVVRDSYGPTELYFPKLNRSMAILTTVPSQEDLHDIIRRKFESHDNKLGSSSASLSDPGATSSQFLISEGALASLRHSSGYLATDIVLPNMIVEEIQEKCTPEKRGLRHANELFTVPTTVSILPQDATLGLQHNTEAFTYSTLLSGSMVWMIWPPTEHNLATLRNAYDAFAKTHDQDSFKILEKFEYGVTFVQKAGDGLRIPPFTPMLALTMEPCVLAKYQVITKDSFFACLEKLPLYMSYWATEPLGAQMKAEFGRGIVSAIAEILTGAFDRIDLNTMRNPIKEKSNILTLLRTWDNVKMGLIGIMDPETKKRLKHVWVTFLTRTTTQRCLICGGAVRRDRPGHEEGHFSRFHFENE
ncbi:hypothetical protein BU24DRAFT_490222 [Aaosphaeria arxii CBS 175.79]|uniref:Uncharacterized protein n=1 Tax=Aaosphaeria arxii CBS 175.79 TaxID=1450172 RepID=A0A6A5XW75_9PLEO|nr:uncharacterized protein BU24DRAFT_490222 [Aaosphaeria arxii CBS 175.79]KAF2016961.1 hypothetical protein BU24DRAFT_490222 [Aaosphaeria arxii CBS 175.79]